MAKINVVVLAAFLFGCAFADLFSGSITELTPGVTPTAGTLLPVLSSTAAQFPQNYYKLWVPENVATLDITFTATDSTCSYLEYYVSGDHVPCGRSWSEGSEASFPCRDGTYDSFSTTADVLSVFPSSYVNSERITPGSYLYVAVGKYWSSDYAETCSYTILTTMTTCATAGQEALFTSSTVAPCAAVSPITAPYVAEWSAASQLTEVAQKLWIPERTAYIHIYVNNTDWSTYVRGNSRFAGGDYYYDCYDSYTSVGNRYELNTLCFNPAPGWYHLYFYTSSTGYYLQGNVSISIKQCAENQAGYNCSYQAWNLTGAAALNGAQYGVEAGEGASNVYTQFNDGFKIFYLSSTNGTTLNYNFTVTLTVASTTTAYLYYNKGGYVNEWSSYYSLSDSLTLNTPQTLALTASDFFAGGSHFIGISNSGSTTLNFTLSSSAAAVSSTTDASTTEATTGEGSGAVSIFASFALIAALIAALF